MMKIIFQYLLLAFMTTAQTIGCAQNNTDKDKITANEFSLTLVLMNDDLWFSIYDTSVSSVNFMLQNELFSELNHAVERKGKELNIIIRASEMVKKSTIDSIVQQIKSRSISKYFITILSEKEVEKIVTAVANMKPPEPIEIKTPLSLIDSDFSSSPSLYFFISKDDSISYKIDSLDNKRVFISVANNDTVTLNNIVAEYKALIKARISDNIYVIGDPKSGYKPFEKIISALKKNNFLKYRLVTHNDKTESGFLMPRKDYKN